MIFAMQRARGSVNWICSVICIPIRLGCSTPALAEPFFSFSTLMLLVGSLTCKTVSRMTYTVLVETLNPTHSLTVFDAVNTLVERQIYVELELQNK